MPRMKVAHLPGVSTFLKGLKEKNTHFYKTTTWKYTRVNQEIQVGVSDKSGDFKDILCSKRRLLAMSSAPPGFLNIPLRLGRGTFGYKGCSNTDTCEFMKL